MGGEGLGEFLGEVEQALILRLIDGVAFGHEEAEDLVGIDLEGADAEVVEIISQFGGPVGARGRRGPGGGILIGLNAGQVAEHVGDDVALGELLAVGGEPTDDMAAFALAGEDLPQGFAAAGGGGDGDDAAGGGVYLGETGHAVVVGHFAGGDAGPQHGGELRLERGEVA